MFAPRNDDDPTFIIYATIAMTAVAILVWILKLT